MIAIHACIAFVVVLGLIAAEMDTRRYQREQQEDRDGR